MPSSSQPATPQGNGPLSGIRILDLTSVVLGPLATQILGDYGADIIKVEPLEGDLARANGTAIKPGMGSLFLAINRNKRSIALNLKSPQGAAVLQRIIADCDVLVHNMRVAAIERAGFGYEAVSRLNPGIVYCAATGFGQGGPGGDKPVLDDIVQAACGLVSLNSIGREQPDYSPTLIADKTAGMAVVNSVLAALFHRERTGQGQYVEVPMFETLVAFTLAEHLGGMTFESAPSEAGYARILAGGRRPAPTADGYIAMLPYTLKHWTAFFQRAGRPDLSEKYNIADRQALNANVADMYREMAQITRTRTTDHWVELCAVLDIPATPIYAIAELPDHPHLKAVGLFASAEHPTQGPIRYVNPPTKFATTPATVRFQAPDLGQHTVEILQEAGFDLDEIEMLAASGTVVEYVAAAAAAS